MLSEGAKNPSPRTLIMEKTARGRDKYMLGDGEKTIR